MYSGPMSKNKARRARAFAFGYEAGVNDLVRTLKITMPVSAHAALDKLADNVKEYAYRMKVAATAVNKGKQDGNHERED